MRLKILMVVILSVFSAGMLFGARHMVSNAQEIKALKSLSGGDTVVMNSGEWVDQKVVLTGVGSKDNPVVLMAQEAGKTILTGSSKLSFSGEYIVVRDLRFYNNVLESDAVVSFRTSSTKFANNSVLTNCAILTKGLPDSKVDYKWVSIYGKENEVIQCTFDDKANMGTLLVVWLTDGQRAGHVIRGNYFSRPRSMVDQAGKTLNGQETLRVGTSTVSMTVAECVVEGNYFYRCNGEVECVSNKSCGNIYRGNIFNQCNGTLTIRHGKFCDVYANAFYGGGAKNTGGVRLIDEGHKVYNNYFDGLTGSGYYAAVCLVQGEVESSLSGYFAAKDCYVVNNTIVNCKAGININHGSTRQSIPVENNIISSNVVVNYNDPKAVNVVVRLTPNAPKPSICRDNIIYGASLRGIGIDQIGGTDMDPELREYRGFFVPLQRTTLAKYGTKGFDFVESDFFGSERDMKSSTPGAFNMIKSIDLKTIPNISNTGTTWKIN